MIFGFITKFFFGIVKKIIFIILVIVIAVWYFFFRDTKINFNSLKDTIYNDYLKGMQVEVQPNSKDKYEINEEIKSQIDLWIKANNLNEYGDPKDTIYLGGTPLYNESTQETINKYDYILSNNHVLLELYK